MNTGSPIPPPRRLGGAAPRGWGVPASAKRGAPPATPPAATPAAPPPWAEGWPDAAIGTQLAPIAPPPIPTAADKLPVDKLKLPKGFNIEVYAADVGNAPTGRQGDKGTGFAGSRLLHQVNPPVPQPAQPPVQPPY